MDHGSAIPPLGYSGILHRAISIEFFLAHYGVLNWMQNPFHLATLLRPNTRHIFGVLSVSHIINLFQLKITLERASDVSCLKTTGVSCAPGQQIQIPIRVFLTSHLESNRGFFVAKITIIVVVLRIIPRTSS